MRLVIVVVDKTLQKDQGGYHKRTEGRTHRTVHPDFALATLLRVSLHTYTLKIVVHSECLKEVLVRCQDRSKKFLLSREVLLLLGTRRRTISIPIY